MTTTPYEIKTITSADGTVVQYRQFGNGPGLVLLHGGMMAAQNFMQLGTLLMNHYTIYIPDRRGRGQSGLGSAPGLDREAQDLVAVVTATGATSVFGLSSGAVIALQTALLDHSITNVLG
jgi:pimeloyl-ACP methyl ester carboxylesterase